MQMVNELENDLAIAVLVKRKNNEQIDSKEVLPLINRIREILEPISAKDHAYAEPSETQISTVSES